MRSPILACLGILTFIGTTVLAACASVESPNIPEIIKSQNGTDPADSGASTTTDDSDPAPAATPVKPPVAPPPVVFDAGAKPDAGDDDDDTGGTLCDPNNEQYSLEALMAEAQGGATTCPNGGSDCDPSQCCYQNPIMASISFCVAK